MQYISQIPAAATIQNKSAVSKVQDEYSQAASERDEMQQDHIFPTVASGRHFDFARLPVTASSIQRKLTVNSPGDAFEREADEEADRVMRMVGTGPISDAQEGIQRKCAACSEGKCPACEEDEEKNMPEASAQSLEGEREEEAEVLEIAVQRKAEFSMPPIPAAARSHTVADRLAGSKSGGELLAASTRNSMEMAFGRDFSRVRVHQDSEAADLSHQLSAAAFTHGSHIYFGSGRFDPERSSGKRLLAHELTHVVQQGHAVPTNESATPVASGQATPLIQRAATWTAPVPHETNNLANTALAGNDAGTTLIMINGTVGGGLLNAPTIAVAPVAAGGFSATVTAVAANGGSVDETVLSAGPWTRVATRASIGTRFPALAQCVAPGNSTFRAIGDPNDAAMASANRRHEDHHATDGQAAFNAIVVPWDTRLTAAQTAGTAFPGATAAAATAALFTAMGGTVMQTRNAFVAAWNTAIATYHGTAAGGPIGAPTGPAAAADCSTSSANYTNPS